jgi:hypothetical protein
VLRTGVTHFVDFLSAAQRDDSFPRRFGDRRSVEIAFFKIPWYLCSDLMQVDASDLEQRLHINLHSFIGFLDQIQAKTPNSGPRPTPPSLAW